MPARSWTPVELRPHSSWRVSQYSTVVERFSRVEGVR